MGHPLKSDVLDARREAGANDAAIRFKMQVQAVSVGFSADEAGFGVGQFTHDEFIRRPAAWRKGKVGRVGGRETRPHPSPLPRGEGIAAARYSWPSSVVANPGLKA